MLVAAAALLFLAAAASAQRGFGRDTRDQGPLRLRSNAAYDGRFTFVRVNYDTAPGGYWAGGRPGLVARLSRRRAQPHEDHERAELLGAHDDDFNTLALEDPDLFKYPVAYIIEVGWWTLTDRGAATLRDYLLKGGFLIVDDFKAPGWRGIPGAGWEPFEANMRRVLPGVRFYDMVATHPIFHSFFEINTLDNFPQAYNAGQPIFRGVFEDNDPGRRLLAIVNYNTDISQYWEWSGRGLRPFDETNEAYKLGVNYIIYGLTH